MSGSGLCITTSLSKFLEQSGDCLVQLEFLWVIITLTGAGLLLLVVCVEAVILIICACHVHKQKRESRGKYSLKAEAKKDGNESVELQLRKGLVVSSQENLSDPHKGTEVYRDAPQSAQPLTDGDAIPIQERQYDAIASSSQKDPQQSKLSVTVENTQYASIDDNTTSSTPAPPPPPPPPPPPLPASNSAMRTPTLQKNPAAPPPTEVFSIGDVGAVTVGDYQYASVDKSGKERASSPQPPPPLPPPPLLLESNKPSLSASTEHLPDHLNAVADTQYAVVDKTRKNLTPPPAPPPPPSFPPSGARSTGDILDYVNSQGGALPASSDPAAQLQAAIDSLYDSVV